mgnify:CR=1 FL=1
MSKFSTLLSKNSIETLENAKKTVPKTSIGRELINNLLYRLKRRGNLMVKMDGHFVRSVQIKLSSNFFIPGEKNLAIWVKPFIRNNKLFFNYKNVIIKASDVFGDGINCVKL